MSTMLSEIPEGEYTCDIMQMENKVDGKNRKVVTWLLKIVGGPYDNQFIQKRFFIVNEKVAAFLKRELKIVGVEAIDAADFEAKKTLAYGKRIRVTASVNEQGFPVLYVKDVLGKSDVPASETKNVGW